VEQGELLSLTARVLESIGIPYMVVGSYASGAYGHPRMTHDIDIVADIREEHVDKLMVQFHQPDFYLSRDAALAAVKHRSQFNVIHSETSHKIDFMIPPDSKWGREQLRRRVPLEMLPGVTVSTASPEDVILSKMLYYREGGSEKHLRDITGMLEMSKQIDQNYIGQWSARLGVTEVWQAVLNRLS
jgi:hypothetical protein